MWRLPLNSRLRERYGEDRSLIVGLWMLEDNEPLSTALGTRIEAANVVRGLGEVLVAIGRQPPPAPSAEPEPEPPAGTSRVDLTTPLDDTAREDRNVRTAGSNEPAAT